MTAGRPRTLARRLCAAACLVAAAGCDAPASTLSRHGASGAREAALGGYLLAVASTVVVVVTALVVVAALRGRRGDPGEVPAGEAGKSGLAWVVVGGIAVPAVILTATFLLTSVTLHAVSSPGRPYAATVEVIGHDWWWEVRYEGATPGARVTTANELHLPVGQPVRVRLSTADVVHSFWVPQLAGKTDLIPGQRNVTWVEAREAGVYYGRCGEYCGAQHAHMEMRVVAEPPARFAAWLEGQRRAAAAPTDPSAQWGEHVFLTRGCANCHAVRGTAADGTLGPDLTHLMSRGTLAAGSLPNTRGTLAGWVADAQGLKPGVLMPTMALRADELQALLDYLETLR